MCIYVCVFDCVAHMLTGVTHMPIMVLTVHTCVWVSQKPHNLLGCSDSQRAGLHRLALEHMEKHHASKAGAFLVQTYYLCPHILSFLILHGCIKFCSNFLLFCLNFFVTPGGALELLLAGPRRPFVLGIKSGSVSCSLSSPMDKFWLINSDMMRFLYTSSNNFPISARNPTIWLCSFVWGIRAKNLSL